MMDMKKKSGKRSFAVGVFLFIVAFLCASGCSFLPAKKQDPPRTAAGLQALDQYAWSCYGRGLQYMEESRYELAREQFSIAASSAVSKTLYEDALDGLRRAEQIIQVKR